jgi:hypothetical protein
MILRIKVDRANFEDAKSDGWVDGQFRGLWAYVELGTEEEYIPKPSDNSKTQYRLFRGCDAFFYDSQELLEEGEYKLRQLNVMVIIYC